MEYKIIRHSDDSLMHYGVMGMKWGVRKSPERTARKVREFSEHYERKLKRSKKYDNKILERRQKNLQKYNKKIEKMKAKRKDFIEGTELIKRGQDTYNDVIKRRMDTKIKAINDPSYKKTFAYKNAGANYVRQILLDSFSTGGQGYTKLKYTVDIAKKKDPKI